MAIVRWNPWNDLFDLHSHVDQLFESLSGNDTPRNGGGEYMNLPVDIRQTDDAFVIEASVPGFRPEDVELLFDDGVLTIKGQRSSSSEEAQGSYVRRERRRLSVFRQLALPAGVRADRISAKFDNGVLRVTLPRVQKAQPQRIPVAADSGERQQPQVVEHQKS